MIQGHSKKQATVGGGALVLSLLLWSKESRNSEASDTSSALGIGIDGPTYVYGDNMSVIHNMLTPESVLKKKSNSICYHFICEAVAMKECLTTHVPTLVKWANLLTKILSDKKRRDLVQGVLFHIYDHG